MNTVQTPSTQAEAAAERFALRVTARLSSGTDELPYDISERLRSEEQISFLARHDSLTGLPNRANFNNRLEADLEGFAFDLRELLATSAGSRPSTDDSAGLTQAHEARSEAIQ